MMEDKIIVFYNNKTYEIITILTPNDTDLDIDEFIAERLRYDENCAGLTAADMSYSINYRYDYDRALADYEKGGEISIDIATGNIVITGTSKDYLTLDSIEACYEFHIEYNTKALSYIYEIEYLDSGDIYVDEETYSDIIYNPEINNYFDTRDMDDLISDISEYGLYFPLFGYRDEDNRFIVTEGIHRAKAIQSLGGTCMCIYKSDGTPFDITDLTNLSQPLELYEYTGNLTFIKRTVDKLNYPAFLCISNNILISNELFLVAERFKSVYMLNNEIEVSRLLSPEFIRQNKRYYSLVKADIQELYGKFLLNKSLFDIQTMDIGTLAIEDIPDKEDSVLSLLDPYLSSMDNEDLKEELTSNGMLFPFVIYEREGDYYVAEGYHRFEALSNANLACGVECLIYGFDKIYYRYPSYAEDFEKEIYIPKKIFPYQEYPYVPGLAGFQIIEEGDNWYKIRVTNDIQLIQAYKLLPMVLKHMINYLYYRFGESIEYPSHLVITDDS